MDIKLAFVTRSAMQPCKTADGRQMSKASYVNRDVLFATKLKNYIHDSAATTIKERKSDFCNML